ncbi:hypothetical protein P872_09530 [Rhodonellum psychrophilum GCM71 = DSM 17998]|uniref:Uncharacterized protein n=1 Tax=Rhodonellum psychrophilum GCM71 = DSM 17998 TaxID=1123057 RepID=U5BXM3_9BACT|nr:hypothetical protein P872_09530 [Rhodonellum psychrophilum GCM71 = DSM 17998]
MFSLFKKIESLDHGTKVLVCGGLAWILWLIRPFSI